MGDQKEIGGEDYMIAYPKEAYILGSVEFEVFVKYTVQYGSENQQRGEG